MSQRENLFEQFPPVSTTDWMDRIVSDLKGADFNKKLVWKTDEGFEVMPFYRREDIENLPHLKSVHGDFPYVKSAGINDNRWLVRQNIEVSDYSVSNRKALDLLMKGVDSLGFVITDPETIRPENLETLLEGINFENVEINFLSAGKANEILSCLIRIFKKSGSDIKKIRGAVEADPLGRLMLNGNLCIAFEAGLDYLASLTTGSLELPLFRTIHINASEFSNAGSTLVQELAFALSMGNEYMTLLTDRGITADDPASKIRFSFGIGSNYFFEIAKIRAARHLWSLIAGAYNPEKSGSTRMEIHCVSSRWNKTVYDPYINLLRTQTEAMSAVLGGTDSLTVEPFDTVYGQTDEFSERLARNQQLLLREESFFDKVADPAGGSYYIEKLTSLIADHSWKLFLEIEESGGFVSALRKGLIQERIKKSAALKRENISTGRKTLLGTNKHPDFNEKSSGLTGAGKDHCRAPINTDNIIEPISLFRGSEELEKIRIAAERASKRPVAFMLPVGDPVMRKVRSQFSAGFFGCGGYIIKDNEGFDNVQKGVKAAFRAGADIIVLCSSDREYTSLALELSQLVKGKAIVVIAGNPSNKDDLIRMGFKYFISIHSNMVDSLAMFNKLLGLN
jgi:methylmalonyl-CoA mutase